MNRWITTNRLTIEQLFFFFKTFFLYISVMCVCVCVFWIWKQTIHMCVCVFVPPTKKKPMIVWICIIENFQWAHHQWLIIDFFHFYSFHHCFIHDSSLINWWWFAHNTHKKSVLFCFVFFIDWLQIVVFFFCLVK